ncbi:MAG: Mg2+ and Co2+ transporter CorB, partial [Oscillospiraceae bacterium]|nr:Mg2+ and Co2+ transporter CorB [Oscillospiraceae bacterium]
TALIVATIISQGHQHTTWFLLIGTATVSVITITGKALGKTVALRHSNQIVYQVALFLCLFAREKRKP